MRQQMASAIGILLYMIAVIPTAMLEDWIRTFALGIESKSCR